MSRQNRSTKLANQSIGRYDPCPFRGNKTKNEKKKEKKKKKRRQ